MLAVRFVSVRALRVPLLSGVMSSIRTTRLGTDVLAELKSLFDFGDSIVQIWKLVKEYFPDVEISLQR